MKSKIILPLVFALLLVAANGMVKLASAEEAIKDFPFLPGEKLTYKLRWGLLTAGYAELEVLPYKDGSGEENWHFVLTIRTSAFVDLVYKVRDRVESVTNPLLESTIFYKKKQREGSTNRDIEVRFSRENLTAVYSNKGQAINPIKIEPGTLDPLSSVYFIRTHELAEKMEIVRPVTDGKKNVLGRARVVRRENVYVAGTKYDAYLVEPDLKDVRGVFEKSKDSRIRLWYTADERRLLVKIRSKVIVGSFTGSLIKVFTPRTISTESLQ